MAWTKVDLSSVNAMEEAIAFCRLVMKKSGQANFRNDLEWAVEIAGRSSVVLFIDQEIPPFGLAFRRTRP